MCSPETSKSADPVTGASRRERKSFQCSRVAERCGADRLNRRRPVMRCLTRRLWEARRSPVDGIHAAVASLRCRISRANRLRGRGIDTALRVCFYRCRSRQPGWPRCPASTRRGMRSMRSEIWCKATPRRPTQFAAFRFASRSWSPRLPCRLGTSVAASPEGHECRGGAGGRPGRRVSVIAGQLVRTTPTNGDR
jgi:hypothetical protein